MPELNWLEFAGVCGIGTVAFVLLFLIIEFGKEIMTKCIEPDEDEYDDCDCNNKKD